MMIYPINEEPQKPICGFLNKQLSPTRRVSDLETQIKQYRQGKYGYK